MCVCLFVRARVLYMGWMQEAGLPHVCPATSLRGGGAYSSPGVGLHVVGEHLPRPAAQKGQCAVVVMVAAWGHQ